jgi:RNA polymerase sigma-70 factor, ECF subfamily
VSDALLKGLAAGREEAFAALYDEYARPLFRVAWTLLRSHQDAEDAVQEVFVGLARSRSTVRRIENLRAYLFGALRHAVTRLARRGKRCPVSGVPDEASREAEREAVDADLSDWLERAVAELPHEQREVLTLKLDGRLTFEEVAEVLEISANTAASRYRYALDKLRTHFHEEYHATRSE